MQRPKAPHREATEREASSCSQELVGRSPATTQGAESRCANTYARNNHLRHLSNCELPQLLIPCVSEVAARLFRWGQLQCSLAFGQLIDKNWPRSFPLGRFATGACAAPASRSRVLLTSRVGQRRCGHIGEVGRRHGRPAGRLTVDGLRCLLAHSVDYGWSNQTS
jgi:hypothetical protein